MRATCSASERSSARSSVNASATVSHTVAAGSKLRCCSSSAMRMPGRRATDPVVGTSSPSRRRMSVVLPAPLRPIRAQRSRSAMVTETSRKISVAPKETEALPMLISVMHQIKPIGAC